MYVNQHIVERITYWKNDLYSDKGQFCRVKLFSLRVYSGTFIAYEPDGTMTLSPDEHLTGPLEEPWYQITAEQWNECFNDYKKYNQPKK